MIKLSPFTIRPLKSMRTEIITLCLNQIGRQKVRSQRMEIIERRGKCRYSHPFTDSRSHHSTPCRQSLPDLRGEGWEQHQIPSSSPCLVSPGKFVQKSRPNNTASTFGLSWPNPGSTQTVRKLSTANQTLEHKPLTWRQTKSVLLHQPRMKHTVLSPIGKHIHVPPPHAVPSV